jgi:hypothetical protein
VRDLVGCSHESAEFPASVKPSELCSSTAGEKFLIALHW